MDTTKECEFARASGFTDAFQAMGIGALLLDRCGKVVRANQFAKTALGHDVQIVGERLTISNHAAAREVSLLIAQALNGNQFALSPPVKVFRDGRQPLAVYCRPIGDPEHDVCSTIRALILICDLDRPVLPAEEHLAGLFNLTVAEARLALRIAMGQTLQAAATALDIAKETARNQLKSIFEKTGTHRQAELVALLSRLLAEERAC